MTKEEIEQALSAFLITVAVVTAILAISRTQVYRLVREGSLEAINIGVGKYQAYRVKSDSVRRMLEEMYHD